MALGTLLPSRTVGRANGDISGRATTTVAFDWLYTALLLLLSAGIYLDGWSHASFGPDQSVFSAYHLLFYSSLTVLGLLLGGVSALEVVRGRALQNAVPAGYALSLLGMVIFGVGGVFDLIGHSLFGFEADMEALLSPSHMTLFVGWALIALGPARSALLRQRRSRDNATTMAGLLPALIGWTLFVNVIAFAAMVYLPTVQNAWMLAELRTDVEFFGSVMGVMGVLFESAIVVGASLWLIRNFRLPPGSFTLFFTLFALLSAIIDLNVVFVPVFIATGLAADALYAALRPSAERPGRSQLFATLLPMLLWAIFYAYAFAFDIGGGVWYSGYLWTGSIVEAGMVGLLLGLLIVPGTAATTKGALS